MLVFRSLQTEFLEGKLLRVGKTSWMAALQKETFLESEGDGWYQRNSADYASHTPACKQTTQLLVETIKRFNSKPSNILEIGCSVGARLDGIANCLGSNG